MKAKITRGYGKRSMRGMEESVTSVGSGCRESTQPLTICEEGEWVEQNGMTRRRTARSRTIRVTARGVANRFRSKFRAVRTNGFASKREAKRYEELRLLEKIGAISDLKCQVRYEIVPKQEGERPVHYVADFEYIEDGKKVTEDCKGFRTPEYKIKRKLMKHVHGIAIRET